MTPTEFTTTIPVVAAAPARTAVGRHQNYAIVTSTPIVATVKANSG
jgi:hypothetical protein